MSGRRLVWRTNLRANLVLWPDVAPNIVALASSDGELYEEDALLAKVQATGTGKDATDTRTIRNTYEVMALSGLIFRSGEPSVLTLTDYGSSLLSFLIPSASGRFCTDGNRRLAAQYAIRALSTVLEYRTIWALWRQCDNVLTNEELNRAMARLDVFGSVSEVASAVKGSRVGKDPTLIGPRIYEDAKFLSAPTDQRKAINPLFLLAGGGRIFIRMEDERRVLDDWACEMIDQALMQDLPDLEASTAPATALLMSEYACSPKAVSP